MVGKINSKKGIKIPHTYVIIFSILLLVSLATYLIPAGEYERAENASGRTVVVEDSYHRVESNPQGIIKVLQAPLRGIRETSEIIGFILIIGGAFAIVQKTKAIDSGLIKATSHLKGKEIIIIPTVMLLFSLGGAVFGMSEETIPFVAIFVPLALALGYDTITGIAMSYMAAQIGFAAAFMNPFTIGIAQGIAELPPMSGMGYRLFVWVVATLFGIAYVMIYASKIKKNPELSITYDHDLNRRKELREDGAINNNFTSKHALVLITFFIGMVTLIWGVIVHEWYISEIAALFVAIGIIAGFIGGLKAGEIANSFIDGAKDLVSAALMVGLARGALILATDGRIIDTMLASVAGVVGSVPSLISAYLMFFIQTIINFFVPSGSGQAALTMPIMAPLGELVGITRQTTVLAYQFGDGFTNMIIPTSGVLMGALGMAKISWDQWAKWMIKLQILFIILGCLLLTPAVLMHLGPF
ncbi:YfcC family protein [Alkaliphilus transvaalensis]|uniref:YfcC family protein n=1 Tax=Alkaliphilus transvaalensis TaxID=114628 RepID=UPI00047A5E03|nr:TIGR00366 family protein [Alkaliphilus transvaalensis]